MVTSENGINFIKSFEGFRAKAYKCVPTEKYYTIGYGHYGADVKPNMVISEIQGRVFLKNDLAKFERVVNKYVGVYHLNQNQYDALVSFAYNCGAGNLDKLVDYGKRSLDEIRVKILAYNKSGGKVLKGLVRRRNAELLLFNTPCADANEEVVVIPDKKEDAAVVEKDIKDYRVGSYIITASSLKVRTGAGTGFRQKKKSELTEDGKKHSNRNGSLLEGTKVTVSRVVIESGNVWGKIPSGFIALEYKGKSYAKKL